MEAKDPKYRERLESMFSKANFIRHLGAELVDVGPGWCETALPVRPEHLQQDDLVHAGVLATLADHTAGCASGTVSEPGHIVLTAEFKINFLRPAVGQRLRCRAEVLKPGRRLIVAESAVHVVNDGVEKLAAKAMLTLAVL